MDINWENQISTKIKNKRHEQTNRYENERGIKENGIS